MGHFAGVGVDAPPEFDEGLGGVGRDGGVPEGVVAGVHEVGHAGEFPDFAHDVGEVVVVRGGTVFPEIRGPRLVRHLAVLAYAG